MKNKKFRRETCYNGKRFVVISEDADYICDSIQVENSSFWFITKDLELGKTIKTWTFLPGECITRTK